MATRARCWGPFLPLLLVAGGCQRTFVMEDLAPGSVAMSVAEATAILGKEEQVFATWGEICDVRYTSYDLYHKGRLSMTGKVIFSIVSFPVFLVRAPIFGLTEVLEVTFSSGRTWQRAFRRHWLWFFPLQGSPAWRYGQALVKLHGAEASGDAPDRRERPSASPAPPERGTESRHLTGGSSRS